MMRQSQTLTKTQKRRRQRKRGSSKKQGDPTPVSSGILFSSSGNQRKKKRRFSRESNSTVVASDSLSSSSGSKVKNSNTQSSSSKTATNLFSNEKSKFERSPLPVAVVSEENQYVISISSDEDNYLDEDYLDQDRKNLPIVAAKNDIIQLLRTENCVIFKGETGSGKTTQIPQYIVEAGLAETGVIAVTQPRRVAATFIADRVAKEYGCQLGQDVGYSVRFDSKTSNQTKIKYMTDGMLLREAVTDPMFWSYSWIVLDEAHERTINTDLLFGIVKSALHARETHSLKPLKVIVMSATIEENKITDYFHNAPLYNILGRLYEIRIFNSVKPQDDYVRAALYTVITIHQNEGEGDILVFLTGIEDIHALDGEITKFSIKQQSNKEAQSKSALKLESYPLYAMLPSYRQKVALMPAQPETRKVIVSTNIAETSLTIPNVKYVVDSGFVKSKVYDSVSGMDYLKLQRISKAQADQRTGRAGRDIDGDCYRLYTKEEFYDFAEFPVPEIMRCHLGNVLLQIVAIGVRDVASFDFIDKPSDENIEKAVEQLNYFGAVEGTMTHLKLTDLGKKMTEFPLDPKFSKIILMSKQLKCTDEILTIIALLSIETVFLSPRDKLTSSGDSRRAFPTLEGDHIRLLKVYRAFKSAGHAKSFCLDHMVDYRGMKKAIEIRKQLAEICRKLNIPPRSCGTDMSLVRKCLAYGLFMNSAQLKERKTYSTLSNNDKVFLHPSSALFDSTPQCVVYTEVVKTSKSYMRNISIVDEEWLQEACPAYFQNRSLNIFRLVSV